MNGVREEEIRKAQSKNISWLSEAAKPYEKYMWVYDESLFPVVCLSQLPFELTDKVMEQHLISTFFSKDMVEATQYDDNAIDLTFDLTLFENAHQVQECLKTVDDLVQIYK